MHTLRTDFGQACKIFTPLDKTINSDASERQPKSDNPNMNHIIRD